MGKLISIMRSALLGLGAIALLLTTTLSLSGCGKKEETSAEGYYEGSMKPKSERGISPTPGGTEGQVSGGSGQGGR